MIGGMIRRELLAGCEEDYVQTAPDGVAIWVISGDVTVKLCQVVLSARFEPPEEVTGEIDVTFCAAKSMDLLTTGPKTCVVSKARKDAGENYRMTPGNWVGRVTMTDLASNTQYYYMVTRTRACGSVTTTMATYETHSTAVANFLTLPMPMDDSSCAPVNFLHMSCANEAPYPVGPALRDAAAGAHFVVFNGDTVYADGNEFWNNFDYAATFAELAPNGTKANLDFFRSMYDAQRFTGITGDEWVPALQMTSVYAVWDDHEVIDNYSGQNDTSKCVRANEFDGSVTDYSHLCPIAFQAFFEMTPVTPDIQPAVPGVDPLTRLFRNTRVGKDAEMWILDLRQYRDANGDNFADGLGSFLPPSLASSVFAVTPAPGFDYWTAVYTAINATSLLGFFPESAWQLVVAGQGLPPDTPYTLDDEFRAKPRDLLGQAQKDWLKSTLLESDAKFKFIVSEFMITEWYVGVYDRWEGYWQDRKEILDFIQVNGIEGVVFLTGDVHASFINNLNPTGIPVWEVTTGPTGGQTFQEGITPALIAGGLDWDTFYLLVNQWIAPPPFGDPNSNNGLSFFEAGTPNYNTVEIKGKAS
eukprot:scaffold5495_cov376-Prasinococcus_capsulatus_cf.AAC.7